MGEYADAKFVLFLECEEQAMIDRINKRAAESAGQVRNAPAAPAARAQGTNLASLRRQGMAQGRGRRPPKGAPSARRAGRAWGGWPAGLGLFESSFSPSFLAPLAGTPKKCPAIGQCMSFLCHYIAFFFSR